MAPSTIWGAHFSTVCRANTKFEAYENPSPSGDALLAAEEGETVRQERAQTTCCNGDQVEYRHPVD
jgi:hypothetical protein